MPCCKSLPLGSDLLALFGRQNDVIAVLAIQGIEGLLDVLAGGAVRLRCGDARVAFAQARKNLGLVQRHTSWGVPLQLSVAGLKYRRISQASMSNMSSAGAAG